MGVYLYSIPSSGGRKMVSGQTVLKSKFVTKASYDWDGYCGQWEDRYGKEFDTDVYYVNDFKDGYTVYKVRAGMNNFYYDTDTYGETVGVLKSVGKNRFEVVDFNEMMWSRLGYRAHRLNTETFLKPHWKDGSRLYTITKDNLNNPTEQWMYATDLEGNTFMFEKILAKKYLTDGLMCKSDELPL